VGKRKDLTYWNIPVPKALDEAVERAVKSDMHVSKSDLVRDAVRRLLLELGMPLEETAGAKR
jgi:Arc/MetJ-type ribon-helix-helix transcriptional regulator